MRQTKTGEFPSCATSIQWPFKQFDTQGIVDAQVKNFETLQRMNETAMTGAQSLFERHAQMMQQAMQEAGEAVKKLGETQPQDLANENIRVLEGAMQKSMENFSEISEMAQGVYSEVGQQMEERIEQSMQELKDTIEKVSQNKP